jgi:hypothetical protein
VWRSSREGAQITVGLQGIGVIEVGNFLTTGHFAASAVCVDVGS